MIQILNIIQSIKRTLQIEEIQDKKSYSRCTAWAFERRADLGLLSLAVEHLNE